MGAVIGQYQHNIDAKGRLFIPAKYREELGETFYVTIGLDGCLSVYSDAKWAELTAKFDALPLSKAVLAVIALYTAVSQWNAYFNALVYIRNEDLKPLQLVIRNILITNQAMAGTGDGLAAQEARRLSELMKYAVIIISTVPIMCVYPFVQKYFSQGVMIGAIKG